ncbi:MAG: PaaI family thioesterase [Hyphomicrobiales bacterium]
MTPRDPDWQKRTRTVFEAAPFIRDVGYQLLNLEPGAAVSSLVIAGRHLQQDGVVHAGVQATMADHTAGTAAATLLGADEIVLTIEFKVNLMTAARGERLVCRARVLKPGRRIVVAEAEVFAVAGGTEALVSKATVTLAFVPATKLG